MSAGADLPLLSGSREYSATIPAADVTTLGIEWYAKVSDGYTTTYAPGTSYLGAYLVADGQQIGVHPVRVLEPPHIVHVPPTVVPRGLDLKIQATSNCSTDYCGARLRWQEPNGSWASRPMARTSNADGTTWTYEATIPARATSRDTVTYQIDVFDGHARDQSISYVAATSQDLARGSLSGAVTLKSETDASHTSGASDVTVSLFGKRTPLGGVELLSTAITDEYGRYEFRDLLPGSSGLTSLLPNVSPIPVRLASKRRSAPCAIQ